MHAVTRRGRANEEHEAFDVDGDRELEAPLRTFELHGC